MTASLAQADVLTHLPDGLREELLESFGQIVTNFREHRWGPAELDGGKFSEIVYCILRGHADQNFPDRASKPDNMVDACRALERAGNHVSRSVRIQIPRVLLALYEIRNNRGVGHVGGEVNPNDMDAAAVLALAKWTMAELVRIFHGTSIATATAVVDSLTARETPLIWAPNGKPKVLRKGLSQRQAILLVLYSVPDGLMGRDDLAEAVEAPTVKAFRETLRRAHSKKELFYDANEGTVLLSPEGERAVVALMADS